MPQRAFVKSEYIKHLKAFRKGLKEAIELLEDPSSCGCGEEHTSFQEFNVFFNTMKSLHEVSAEAVEACEKHYIHEFADLDAEKSLGALDDPVVMGGMLSEVMKQIARKAISVLQERYDAGIMNPEVAERFVEIKAIYDKLEEQGFRNEEDTAKLHEFLANPLSNLKAKSESDKAELDALLKEANTQLPEEEMASELYAASDHKDDTVGE